MSPREIEEGDEDRRRIQDNLKDVYRKHFPTKFQTPSPDSDECLQQTIDDIDLYRAIYRSMQEIEGENKSAQSDLEHLNMAVRGLVKVEEHLRKIGLWGGKFLEPTAIEIDEFDGDQFSGLGRSALQSRDIVSEEIAKLRKNLKDAADEASQEMPEAATEEDRRGRPAAIEAKELALKLYDHFFEFSGKRPTVPSNRATDEKYGPFLQFVTDVFGVFKIEVLPVTAAVNACRVKNPQKK